MNEKMTVAALLLTTLLIFGCYEDSGNGSDQQTIDRACSKMVQYCPTGYVWSSFISGEDDCKQKFNCVHDFYSGNCRANLLEGMNCLADVSGEPDCSACSDMLSQLMYACDYPQTCLE